MSGGSKPSSEAHKVQETKRRQRSKNLAILIALCVFALLMYAVTLVRMKESEIRKRGVGPQSSETFSTSPPAALSAGENTALRIKRSARVNNAMTNKRPQLAAETSATL